MTDKKIVDYFQDRFERHGLSEQSLGWTKGKQLIRFSQLTRNFQLEGKELIDIGCGFGDFHRLLQSKSVSLSAYTGFDLVPDFIKVARERWSGNQNNFVLGNYLDSQSLQADYVIGSGLFGLRIHENEGEQYAYVERVLRKALNDARIGISFDFISDKVDFRSGDADFHASPTKILELAYGLSRNLLLDNSCMPFEFSLCIFKDQSFPVEKTIFNRYLKDNPAQEVTQP